MYRLTKLIQLDTHTDHTDDFTNAKYKKGGIVFEFHP